MSKRWNVQHQRVPAVAPSQQDIIKIVFSVGIAPRRWSPSQPSASCCTAPAIQTESNDFQNGPSAFLRRLDGRELPQQGQVVGRLESTGEHQRPAERRQGQQPSGQERRDGRGKAPGYGGDTCRS